MNDQTSRDPRAVAEARRLAADLASGRAPSTAPTYDPVVVAREVYEQTIDRRVASDSFDQVWQAIQLPLEHAGEPVLGVVAEHEFRHFVAGAVHLANARAANAIAEREVRSAHVMRGAYALDLQKRLGFADEAHIYTDVAAGVARICRCHAKKGE